VYDEDRGVIEDPADDGGRHRLWVTHTVRDRQWAYRTRLGASFDLGRLINYVADYVDYNVSWMRQLGHNIRGLSADIQSVGPAKQTCPATGADGCIHAKM
jgi:hypothetical protein